MVWLDQLQADPLPWLLDESAPGVRYLAMRDLVQPTPSKGALAQAQAAAHTDGPIAAILDQMDPQGYWEKPGPGYLPKYRSIVWSLITLAQLGASVGKDARINRACEYLMEHAWAEGGQFTSTGAPSGTCDCLQGNLCAALTALGYQDPRLEISFEWMARTVTGEGLAPPTERKADRRYYAGQYGPTFRCGANNKLPCAWGGAKVMLALGMIPTGQRTPLIQAAIDHGVKFLFSVDPAEATYPSGWAKKPSGNWWKFGYPVYYVTDILQIAQALVNLGYGQDPRLQNTLRFILEKQDEDGRWALEYSYAGKTWVDFGAKKEPSRWVTLRALRVLSGADSASAG
jgi:hypothetical protein